MFKLLFVVAALTVQNPDTLSTSRITADRSITAASAAPLRIEGRAWMDRTGAKDLSEVLRGFAGVSVKDYGGIGGLKTVSLRGFGSQHTGVCYDGVNITDMQNGQVDISRFNLDILESVSVTIGQGNEIFRSARSLSGAGVLELKTMRPKLDEKDFRLSSRLIGGSFGTVSPYLRYERKLSDRFCISTDANFLSSRGDYPYTVVNGKLVTQQRRLGSEILSARTEINLYGDVGSTGTLTAKLSADGADRGLPGPVILYTQDPTEHLQDFNTRAAVVWSSALGESLQAEAKGSFSRTWNRYTDSSAKYQQMEDERFLQLEHYLSGVLLWNIAPRFRMSMAQDFAYNSLATSFPDCQFPRRMTSLTAASMQYSSERLVATASLLGTLISESVESGTAASGLNRLSPSLSASWLVCPGVHLRASWRDGFRAPTFNDLYYSKLGNTNLLPEKASQFNLGASWVNNFQRGGFELGADIYHNDVRDKIVATPTMFIWRMRNIGKVSMDGIDLNASGRWRIAQGWNAIGRMSYSWQRALDVTDPESKSYKNQIAYTPRNSGAGALSIDSPWATLCYSLTAVGERFVLGQNKPSNRLDPYLDHGLCLSREFKLRWGSMFLSAEALNLADINYEIIQSYPMAGRNYRMTIKITL